MAADLPHGCRSEYGPLELRIESAASLSDFTAYVEDSRTKPRTVYQQSVQYTLESAKEYAVLVKPAGAERTGAARDRPAPRLDRAAPLQKVDDEHDQRHHQQQVNQTAADMKGESRQP